MRIVRRLAVLLSPLLLLACASQDSTPETPQRPAWMPPPLTSMAYSSRIGIITALDNQIVHVNAGVVGVGNSRTEETASFDLPGYVAESLRKGILARTPYQPVFVRPSARLVRDKLVWQKEWNERSQSLGAWQQEYDAILKQNQLKMLIIVTAPEIDDGVPGTGQKIQGSGWYTRSFFGKKQTAVFSTLRFYRVSGEPGKLLSPVSSPEERTYADILNFPSPAPLPLPKPMQNAVDQAVRNLIDQKVGAFITMMK